MVSFLALALVAPMADNQPIALDGDLVHPRNLFVKVEASSKRLLRQQKLEVIQEFDQIGYVLVRAPESQLQLTRKNLKSLPGVIQVDFDRAAKLAFDPNDTYFPDQWSLQAMNVPSAWDVSMGSVPITVAVIDTGVNVNHPDLMNNVWTNLGETPANGIDDDGNGFVDDVNGYNFSYGNGNPVDNHGHGTACSSIIAATQNNGIGIAGVAPGARIMAIKAATDYGYFYDSATVPAYIYAADNGARIFSCSFYADSVSPAEHEAIRYAVSQGVLPIVAAGNENSVIPFYPAAYEESMAVASLRYIGGLYRSSFSNFGTWVDVAAPGSSIHVATAWGGYAVGSGTSFACPNTAGVAALLWSTKPTATALEIRAAIEDTAFRLDEYPNGEFTNYGAVDALAAMNVIQGTFQPERVSRFRYMSPVGYRERKSKAMVLSRIYGRGFEDKAKIVIKKGHRHLPVVENGRNFIDFYNVPGPERIELFVNGELVGIIPEISNGDYMYPMIEASTQNGAELFGLFGHSLRIDRLTLNCSTRYDGYLRMEGTFTRVPKVDTMTLSVTREYGGSGYLNGNEAESLYLYNWGSGSYPYGYWEEVNFEALPVTETTTNVTINDFARFVDDDGWVYLLVQTSGDWHYTTGYFNQVVLKH